MRVLALGAVLVVSTPALAVPAFARKTGLSCSSCHEVWPRLNDFGVQFRDNGYRLKRNRDAPVQQDPSYWPIAMRTTVGYQYLRESLIPTEAGDTVTAQTGTFGFSGLDVFAAGTLADRVSFLVTYTPTLGSAGFLRGPASGDLESAFVGLHDLLGTWLNLRVGKHSVDLPEDEHRTITLTQGYNAYHVSPHGSATAFAAGDNQVGVEVYGHSELSRVRYSFSLVNAGGAPLSNNVISSPVGWGHLQVSHLLENPVLAEVKAGVFGALGSHPLATELGPLPPDAPVGAPNPPITGSASHLAQFRRYGAELHLYFLSNIYPLTATGVIYGGNDDAALVSGATANASFLGGWGELSWTPTIHLTFIGRWERIRTTDNGGTGALGTIGDQTILVGAIRHTFELTNRTEVALHAEISSASVRSDTGDLPTTTTALLGLDVAF